jgi:hypothetical protein
MKPKLMAVVSCMLCGPAAAPDAHAEWSAEQRKALSVLQQAVDAEKKGDFASLPPLYHDQFTAWNLAEAAPVRKAEFLKAEEELLKTAKFPGFDITPISIEIAKETAVVNVTYAYTLVTSGGERSKTTGRWNVVLIRKDTAWLSLGCTWIDTK